jgi:hypothetical protein
MQKCGLDTIDGEVEPRLMTTNKLHIDGCEQPAVE